MATAMAVHYVGATPVFVDVEPDTLCLDPQKARAAITRRTRAMLPVHIYGSMADLDAILELAREHDIKVVEDCAHMQGGRWRRRGVGSWGDVGSFSFQQSKTLAAGEGGICLTNDDALADRLYRLKHIGYGRDVQQGEAEAGPPPGLMCYNFRGTAFQATILEDQIEELGERVARYEAAAARIGDRLATVPGVRLQGRGREASPQGYYAIVFIFEDAATVGVSGARLREAIRAEGLPVGGTYGPVYRHMLYNLPPTRYRVASGGCPVAETVGSEAAAVLLHHWLGSEGRVLDAIGDIVAKVAASVEALRCDGPART
jgi:dTDP-4-amino-4,6-dideoxygalactose transaminase